MNELVVSSMMSMGECGIHVWAPWVRRLVRGRLAMLLSCQHVVAVALRHDRVLAGCRGRYRR